MPVTSATTTSPGTSHSCGVRPAPTPSGVPVAMMSPGSSVIAAEMSEISVGILNSMCRVFERCFSTPLTVSQSGRLCGSGIASAVMMQGPKGAKVSWPLE